MDLASGKNFVIAFAAFVAMIYYIWMWIGRRKKGEEKTFVDDMMLGVICVAANVFVVRIFWYFGRMYRDVTGDDNWFYNFSGEVLGLIMAPLVVIGYAFHIKPRLKESFGKWWMVIAMGAATGVFFIGAALDSVIQAMI